MHRYSSTRRRAYLTVSLLSAVAVGALTSAASAQTTTDATSVAEVTVTARHRLESVAVSADRHLGGERR